MIGAGNKSIFAGASLALQGRRPAVKCARESGVGARARERTAIKRALVNAAAAERKPSKAR